MDITGFVTIVVLPALSGGGAGWLLIHFFGRRLVEHRLAKDLEKYRVELSERTAGLKAQLSIYAHEQNVAASRVDADRAAAVSDIYAAMRAVVNPITSIMGGSPIVNGEPEDDAKYYYSNAVAAHKAAGILSNRLADLAIFFDEDTYREIVRFAKSAANAAAVYLGPLQEPVHIGEPPDRVVDLAEAGREGLTREFNDTLRPAHRNLVRRFRLAIGIEHGS